LVPLKQCGVSGDVRVAGAARVRRQLVVEVDADRLARVDLDRRRDIRRRRADVGAVVAAQVHLVVEARGGIEQLAVGVDHVEVEHALVRRASRTLDGLEFGGRRGLALVGQQPRIGDVALRLGRRWRCIDDSGGRDERAQQTISIENKHRRFPSVTTLFARFCSCDLALSRAATKNSQNCELFFSGSTCRYSSPSGFARILLGPTTFPLVDSIAIGPTSEATMPGPVWSGRRASMRSSFIAMCATTWRLNGSTVPSPQSWWTMSNSIVSPCDHEVLQRAEGVGIVAPAAGEAEQPFAVLADQEVLLVHADPEPEPHADHVVGRQLAPRRGRDIGRRRSAAATARARRQDRHRRRIGRQDRLDVRAGDRPRGSLIVACSNARPPCRACPADHELAAGELRVSMVDRARRAVEREVADREAIPPSGRKCLRSAPASSRRRSACSRSR
jgi:hypothetical protein